MSDLAAEPVVIPAEAGVAVDADLTVPDAAQGLVIFAHGSGSSRHSPRNRSVAAGLHHAGLATLLLDLLTADEDDFDRRTGALRFDIDLLAGRLDHAFEWASQHDVVGTLPFGYFGASTGAAAALLAAARRPERIGAVVSRGGRPDLSDDLPAVRAPNLLIVGGNDPQVLAFNREAAGRLGVTHEIEVVPGATHLFEEPGALEEVTRLAAAWFTTHLGDR